MVLESIINPIKAEENPRRLFLVGFLYATIGLFLGYWVFADQASLVMVFLTVFACIPLLYKTMKVEEEKDLKIKNEGMILKEHSKALSFLILLFFGMVIAFSLWYTLLPASTANSMFRVQTQMITSLNQHVTGHVTNLTLFSRIFMNNLKVLIFCILFSFIYGAGAIFILTWNASVIGAAIGNFVRTNISGYAAQLGLGNLSSYFYAASMGLLRYSIHGTPEILAYFVAGLAGGIISVAVMRHNFSTKAFERILLDSSDLIMIAVFLLFVAGLLEVYITPLFF